jgi:opacity protein-like surface antigen
MKRLLISVIFFITPQISFAQQAFDGPFGQIAIGAAKADSNETTDSLVYSSLNAAYQNFNFDKTNFVGSFALGLSKSFENLNIAVTGFYNASSSNFGAQRNNNNVERQANIKDVYGLTIEPGYYINKKFITFAKIGVAWANVNITLPEANENFGKSSGFLYGLGFKYDLYKNWYAGAELYQISFPTKSYSEDDGFVRTNYTFKTKYNYGGIVIGYKF